MTRTLLITGATGQVSGALLAELATRPAHVAVRALVRGEAQGARVRAAGAEPVFGDLDDPDSLPRAFEGVDDVWQLTPPGPRAPEHAMNTLWAARQAGAKRVVRMSAIGAAHDAPTRNGRLHALSDEELIASGLRWTILRPHFFMQNLLGFAPGVAENGTFYFNVGSGRLGLVDVRDIAAVAASVLLEETGRHDGRIYTPTGPESLGLEEVAATLARVLERPVKYVAIPDEAARAGFVQAGFTPWLAGMTVEYGRAYARGWGDFTTTHVRDVTGRDATSFATFARHLWPRLPVHNPSGPAS
jgi:uncharacterized protein YbjT (DUF2867 family)